MKIKNISKDNQSTVIGKFIPGEEREIRDDILGYFDTRYFREVKEKPVASVVPVVVEEPKPTPNKSVKNKKKKK